MLDGFWRKIIGPGKSLQGLVFCYAEHPSEADVVTPGQAARPASRSPHSGND